MYHILSYTESRFLSSFTGLQYFIFCMGFDFKQSLFFMYNENIIYNYSFKQSKLVIYTGFYLEMRFVISFGFGLFTLSFSYHPEPFLPLHSFLNGHFLL